MGLHLSVRHVPRLNGIPPPSFDLMRITTVSLLTCLALLIASPDSRADEAAPEAQQYEGDVLPLLRRHCYSCHSHQSGKARGGLVVDSVASLHKGGDSGPAIDVGDAKASLLITAIQYDDESLQMPPGGKLDEKEIQVLVDWIASGVPAPPVPTPNTGSQSGPEDPRQHWAFSPLQTPSIPRDVRDGSDAIDFLVQKARSAAGVTAVDAADKRTVVQRLYSDLIGLPASPEELESLSGDGSPSLAVTTERLLAMAEFGERWGRHWLDVARYADSNGCSIESNNTHDNAWRYRDYVIASLNDDKPYDQFVVEQIAGDMLDHVSTTQRCEQLIATGFLLLGPKAFGTGSFDQLRFDVIDEQIDTVGKAMLGLSLGCARCHDHKFDPVSSEDYYALAGIFSSTNSVQRQKGWRQGKTWNRVKLPILDSASESALIAAHEQTKSRAENGELKKAAEEALQAAQDAMAELRSQSPDDDESIDAAQQAIDTAQREMKNASNMAKVIPVISPVPVAMAVSDKETPTDEPVRIRGEVDNKGDVIARRLPQLFGESDGGYRVPADQSGRLQLALWMTDSDRGAGALLARVAVNRIWGHLFADPLVATPDNFGLTGQTPTHPDLLDYLADRFIQSGWSTKSLISDIVGTKTYRLAAAEHAANEAVDPGNVRLWRYQPKRIDVEVLRDSMLAISGRLDRRRGGKTLQHLGLVSLGGDHLVLDAPSPYLRRSVYIPIYRDTIGLTDEVDSSMAMLSTFDFADPNLMAGSRPQTVVPAQSLFLMNADFVHQQAKRLAGVLLSDPSLSDDTRRTTRLFSLVYGRDPSTDEIDQSIQFVRRFVDLRGDADGDPSESRPAAVTDAWTSLCQAMLGSNEFLFLD